LGIISSTTIVSNGSDTTTYVCEQFIAEMRKKALPIEEVRPTGSSISLGIHWNPMIDGGYRVRGRVGVLTGRALMADVGLISRRVINVMSRANGTELGSGVGALKAKRRS